MENDDYLLTHQVIELLNHLAEEVHFWRVIRDDKGQILTWKLVYVNPPALKTWGRGSLEELKGKTTDEIFGIGATAHYLPLVNKITSEQIAYSFIDYFPNLDKHFRFTSIPLGDYFITTGIDITDLVKERDSLYTDKITLELIVTERTNQLQKTVSDLQKALDESDKLREELRREAIRDHLTGLFNRKFMEEFIEREIKRATRSNENFGVIIFDIDYFKNINDTYGHQVGDVALKKIGKTLLNTIRRCDIACRYGGDEFLLVLPETSLKDTILTAEKIRLAVKELSWAINEIQLSISISLGVAEFPRHGSLMTELIQQADTALYKAKTTGRNRAASI